VIADALRDQGAGIPMLGIEADMVDSRTYSDIMVKERLAAFMETVSAAKGGRTWSE
jgi:hypothetical protein